MRAAYQVLVIPYRKVEDEYKFAIFSRSDMNCWQWIAGGGEDFDKSILDTAKRESYEEAGISSTLDYIPLDTKTSIPVSIFGEFLWGDDVYVIPEYCFGVKIDDVSFKISSEHSQYKWVTYSEAIRLLKYDRNKTALWELVTRLERR
ncbi:MULTISPECIES: NUDIX pyrophosphatase [unclassified Fusibacter]|uniref:NUDIX hydrolase n=1 Tax=unclassified Fusibacter TaxID=2624464 RepID=UPI001011035B|nr:MULTISPECIES: NUDIX domain-containing protein [unclassified Fusibacter]MCK8060229.1 NUDIX domain-containing protein [Fusibacter sp. A2]NPE22368.1 NUDIX domain-containing protein [Fusibacter sp. A1]RXV61140.1 NUDIX domain-containing protein [Fusibacter sp. A1]